MKVLGAAVISFVAAKQLAPLVTEVVMNTERPSLPRVNSSAADPNAFIPLSAQMLKAKNEKNLSIKKIEASENSTADNSAPKPSSPGKMQKEVERDQAPKDVDLVHNPHVKGGKPHVHYKDGTSSNNDGTIHDKKGGYPVPVKKVVEWLKKHNWIPPPPPPKN